MITINNIVKTEAVTEDKELGTLFYVSFFMNDIKLRNIRVFTDRKNTSKIIVRIPSYIELNKHQWWFIQDHFNDWYQFELLK